MSKGMNIDPRITDVLLLAPIPIAMLVMHPMSAWLLFCVIGLVGLYEWRKIVCKTRELFYTNRTRLALMMQLVVSVVALFSIPAALFIAVATPFVYLNERPYNRYDLAAGQLAMGLLMVFAHALRSGWTIGSDAHQGLVLFGLALTISVVSDSAAYFVGKAIGRHKFAPVISPKKTWEGAIGGWVFAVIAAIFYCGCFVPQVATLNILIQIILFWLLAFAGQLGDLGESMLKRKYGVKDSGLTLRSHGGILDRFDSIGPILILLSLAVWILI